jgi:HD-like signal output (HDOD) protein
MPEERAFTLALMHDIGRLGMFLTTHDAYVELAGMDYAHPAEFLDAEADRLGMNHCKAGLWLARVWGLPGDFCDSAAAHHDATPDARTPWVTLAGLACRLAHSRGFAVENCRRPHWVEAISYAEPALARKPAVFWEQMYSRAYNRLLRRTDSFCDIDALRNQFSLTVAARRVAIRAR